MPLVLAAIEEENPNIKEEDKKTLLDLLYIDDNGNVIVNNPDETVVGDETVATDGSEFDTPETSGTDEKSNPTPKQDNKETVTQPKDTSQPEKQEVKEKANESPAAGKDPVNEDPVKRDPSTIKPVPHSTSVKDHVVHESEKDPSKKYWAFRHRERDISYAEVVYKDTKDSSGKITSGSTHIIEDFKSKSKTTPQAKSIIGYVPYYFEGEWDKLKEGFTVNSVLDVCLIMNLPETGIFNKKCPYLSLENTEYHMLITEGVARSSKYPEEGVGIYKNQTSAAGDTAEGYSPIWPDSPFWCGMTAAFFIRVSGNKVPAGVAGTGALVEGNLPKIINTPNNYGKDPSGKTGNLKVWQNELNTGKNPEGFDTGWKKQSFLYPGLVKWWRSLPSGQNFDWINNEGTAACFIKGFHYTAGKMTKEGVKVIDSILNRGWQMAVIVHANEGSRSGHIELCIGLKPDGRTVHIGGNTGGSTPVQRDGDNITCKNSAIYKIGAESDAVFLIKVETPNKFRQGGLNSKFNNTETFQKYVDALKNKTEYPFINDDFLKILQSFGISPV